MLTPYLFSFNCLAMPRQQVLDFLDTLPQVLNWYAVLAESIIVISEHNAAELRELIRNRYPYTFFIITEIPRGNNDGLLPKAAWDFINNPRSSGRWK